MEQDLSGGVARAVRFNSDRVPLGAKEQERFESSRIHCIGRCLGHWQMSGPPFDLFRSDRSFSPEKVIEQEPILWIC